MSYWKRGLRDQRLVGVVDVKELVGCCFVQALEHYTDLYDIKRAVVHTHLLNPEVRLQPEICLLIYLFSFFLLTLFISVVLPE